MLSSTVMNAVRLSLEICPAPRCENGLCAEKVSGRAFIALNESWIACLLSESVTFSPPGARKTIGFWPFCWGLKRSASRSDASWLPVPGSSRLFEVFDPNSFTRAVLPANRTTQAPSTTHLWWAANNPNRCSARAKRSRSGSHPASSAPCARV